MASKDQSGKSIDQQSLKSRPHEQYEAQEAPWDRIEPSVAFRQATTRVQLKPQDVLSLQHSVGNKAVRQLLEHARPIENSTLSTGSPVQLEEKATAESDHDKKAKKLKDNGITLKSSGGCSDKAKSTCTSLDGMRDETIDGIIAFKEKVGVDLVVTGGTETGHEEGSKSHGTGYKIDISLNDKVKEYVEKNFTKQKKKRADGATVYKDSAGNAFALEGNHWDITFN